MTKQEKLCRNYARKAMQDLKGNHLLGAYLVGLADAWRLVGAISRETKAEIVEIARRA